MEREVRWKKNNYWMWVALVMIVLVLAVVWYFTRTDTVANTNQDVNKELIVNSSNLNQANGIADANANNTNAQSNQNSATALQEYSNTEYDFSLSYPSTWTTTTSVTGSGADKIFALILNDPKHSDTSVSVSVMSDSLEGQVKNSISISTDKKAIINGQPAQRLTGGSAKDGTPVTLVLFKKSGTLYSLRGSGQDFESIVNSFEMQ